MSIRALKVCVGTLVLATTFGVWAQGGGEPISPEAASALVASKAKDKQLASDVTAAVTGAGVNGSKLKVRTYHGVVTLKGSVPSADQVQAASTAAANVQGVTAVKNKLSVRK
ncbi:BON domain-containing protein [Paraburkholderia sacchari]|uniref:BON domain-containing protein n=1 Tax=Paraburkholderia sacchari TaxID=159450 RepID=A0A8T6ZD11_9BURK|nr:BON domain-containing protein [Paraburkholderia sacchari]NLP62585.1 BON domain-containing protein [Paraburkholderia sacchari]